MSIIIFLIVLAILILSHEFGHFIAAKRAGVRVDEFAFGFPPRLFKFKRGETTYSFNLIPFGGFVKIYGEDTSTGSAQEEINDPRSFASKKPGIRAMVVSAGVLFNLVLAWALLSFGFTIGMPTSISAAPSGAKISDAKTIIIQIAKNSPAELAGIMAGDEIIGFSTTEEFQNFVNQNKGKETEIKFKRNNESFSKKIVPRFEPPLGEGPIGIVIDKVGIAKIVWYQAIWEGLKMTYQFTKTIILAIFYFISGAIKGLIGLEGLIGPVGIMKVTGAAAQMGLGYLLSFVALLSINLAIINFLPLPALDGGRLLFILIEKIKGSPVNSQFSAIVHTIGLILLLILMAIITYKDILRLI